MKFNFAIMMFPVCYRLMTWMRSSILEEIFPIDSAMIFHRFMGVFIFLLGIAHMIAHCFNLRHLSRAQLSSVNSAFNWSLTYLTARPIQFALILEQCCADTSPTARYSFSSDRMAHDRIYAGTGGLCHGTSSPL